MLERFEEEGCLDENEVAKILMELVSNNGMPGSVDLGDREQTSSLSQTSMSQANSHFDSIH
jgi:hypothetical protein